MEFVQPKDLRDLFREYGLLEVEADEDRVELTMGGSDTVVRTLVRPTDSSIETTDGENEVFVDAERLAPMVDHIVHVLHGNQLLLLPAGRWRHVFDAVAFSLADNEEWQAIERAATVELNSRDPLLCSPADVPVLSSLITALFADADQPQQNLMIVASAAPVLVEVLPFGPAIRVSVGNEALADELAEAFGPVRPRGATHRRSGTPCRFTWTKLAANSTPPRSPKPSIARPGWLKSEGV